LKQTGLLIVMERHQAHHPMMHWGENNGEKKRGAFGLASAEKKKRHLSHCGEIKGCLLKAPKRGALENMGNGRGREEKEGGMTKKTPSPQEGRSRRGEKKTQERRR